MKIKGCFILSTSPPSQTARKSRGIAGLNHRRFLYRGSRCYPTGKERDSETGLYYYGARYLDSRTGRWLSGDPAVGEYVPSAPINDEARKRNGNLPGQGGVFNYVNLHVYHYAGNNPVKYSDPNGEKLDFAPGSSSKFKSDVFRMKLHLLTHGNYAAIRALENRSEIIYIRQGEENDFYFDDNKNEIVMDTRSGLTVGKGKIQSPALGFLHEVEHALNFLENPEQYIDGLGTIDSQYDNIEERRVIEGTETPAALRMGEPTRDNHGGVGVQVESPTYSENTPRIPYRSEVQ